MLVFVKNKHGKSLMPCKPQKARQLLQQKKARIVGYNPFTIQLLYGSSGYKQSVNLGISLEENYVGMAINSGTKIIAKGKIEFRNDVSKNLLTRKIYRRNRRTRKTRYRKPKFLNRKKFKKEGWLPPSIYSKMNNTFMWIDKFVNVLPNPTIFLTFALGNAKSKFRKESTYISIIHSKIQEKYLNINIVHNNTVITTRKLLNLSKSCYNNAIAVIPIKQIEQNNGTIFKIKQFRKKKRSLHEATARKGRKQPNITQKRNCKNTKCSHGFYLNDKVKVFNKIGFISGFYNYGCYVKDIQGKYITIPNKTYKQVSFKHLEFLNHNNNWQFISSL